MANDPNLLSGRARTLWGQVQEIFGGTGMTPVLTSTGRTQAENNIPGASKTSQHLTGDAFDFQVMQGGKIVDPMSVQNVLASSGIGYGQNIAEYGLGMGPRNHLSVPTDKLQGQNLVARDGKYSQLGKTLAASGRSQANEVIAKSLRSLGIGKDAAYEGSDAIAGVLSGAGSALKAPGEAIKSPLENLLMRGAVGAIALLLLAAAIFSIAKGNNPVTMVKSALT